MGRAERVVAIGGGHGLSRTLEALRLMEVHTTAVVTVADDGGSSGRLRRERGIIALGDMRMGLLALAPAGPLQEVFGHRFNGGGLDGHSLGNLALVAMIEQAGGDVLVAMDRAARLLDCRGRVWPCTTDDVTLVAAIDGTEVEGQVAVATTEGRDRRVWLEPAEPTACPLAMEAIDEADLVVLGPGSLFTSIIPNLLVPGIAEALDDTDARLVYAANLTAQAGETAGMSARDHVDALLDYLPERTSIEVLCHAGPGPDGSGPALQPNVAGRGVRAIHHADLAEGDGDHRVGAHDPVRLAAAIGRLLDHP